MKRIVTIAIFDIILCGSLLAAICGDLKQSTAVTIKFGPIVSAADGYTPETALTAHAAHIRIAKNNGDFGAKNSATVPSHDEYGFWDVTLDATDTNTRGILTVYWTDANDVVIVPQQYRVLDPNEYDRMYSTGEVDVYSLGGSKQSALDLKDFADAGYDPATNLVESVLRSWDGNDVPHDSWSTTAKMLNVNVEYVRKAAPVSTGEMTTAAETAIDSKFHFDGSGHVESSVAAWTNNVVADVNQADVSSATSSGFSAALGAIINPWSVTVADDANFLDPTKAGYLLLGAASKR